MKVTKLFFYPLLPGALLFILACEDKKDATEKIEIVMDPQALLIEATTVEISWVTNVPSNSTVYYGLTEVMTDTAVDQEERESHLVTITDLLPDTSYYFQVVSESEYFRGTAESDTNIFTTEKKETTGEIEIVTDPQALLIEATTVEISWVTNVPSNSTVYYGLTEVMTDTAVDQEERESHLVTITDLLPDTSYYFQVASESEYFSGTAVSDTNIFATEKKETTGEIEIVTDPQALLIDATTVEISWVTNVPSNSNVYFGLTEAMTNTATDQEERESHLVTITDLLPDTSYYFQVASESEYFSGTAESNTNVFSTGSNEQSYFVEGWQYFSNGEYGNAMQSFSTAIQLNATFGAAYIASGWCYIRLEDMVNALDALNTGLNLDDSLLEGYAGRSIVHLEDRSYSDAISDAIHVVQSDSVFVFQYENSIDHELVRLVLAQAYYATQQYESAQEQCDIIAPNNGLDPVMSNSWVVNGNTFDTYIEALLALIQYLVLQS